MHCGLFEAEVKAADFKLKKKKMYFLQAIFRYLISYVIQKYKFRVQH